MRIFIRTCQAAGIPFLAVYDSDERPRRKPARRGRGLNAEIAELAGPDRIVMLSPDFEAVAHLHGHRRKPARAWQRFSAVGPDHVPAALRRVVETVLELAR
jgi:hypothetical protein